MDLAAVAAEIAVRYGAMTAPTGYASIAFSTYLLPQAIVQTPTLLVHLPTGTFHYSPGGLRSGSVAFPCRLYIADTSDLPHATAAVYAWWDVLLESLVGEVQLGEADSANAVTWGRITDARVASMPYAPAEFLGIEFTTVIGFAQATSPVA